MAQINPYLTFQGNCEEAFNFYKSVFGGDFTYVGRYDEMPEEFSISPEEKNRIMHISLPISKETILMGADTSAGFGGRTVVGNNISISINASSEEEAKRIFSALSAGGEITMPLDKSFWGALFGILVDRFGIMWMMSYDYGQAPQN